MYNQYSLIMLKERIYVLYVSMPSGMYVAGKKWKISSSTLHSFIAAIKGNSTIALHFIAMVNHYALPGKYLRKIWEMYFPKRFQKCFLKTYLKPYRKKGFQRAWLNTFLKRFWKTMWQLYMNRFYQSVSERFEKRIFLNGLKIVFENQFKTFQE